MSTKFTMNLSLSSINEYKKILEQKKKDLSKIAENIVRRTSEVGLENNYQSTEMMPIKAEGNVVSGGIKTTDEKDTYREFGTGRVGENSPHYPEVLALANWQYYLPSDFKATVNGVEGWYTNKDEFGEGKGFVTGIPAEKKFYEAVKRMQEALPNIAREELSK